MTNLSDTQTLLLSAAAARETLALYPIPDGVQARGAALDKAIAALVKRGLVAEQPATAEKAACRTEHNGTAVSLAITMAGLAAINAEPASDTATAALEADPTALPTVTGAARPNGKLGLVLDAIGTDAGATLDELVAATGWLPHTARAALTRLRQRGFPIVLEIQEGRKAYRLGAAG